jgi:hypothetical protein
MSSTENVDIVTALQKTPEQWMYGIKYMLIKYISYHITGPWVYCPGVHDGR